MRSGPKDARSRAFLIFLIPEFTHFDQVGFGAPLPYVFCVGDIEEVDRGNDRHG